MFVYDIYIAYLFVSALCSTINEDESVSTTCVALARQFRRKCLASAKNMRKEYVPGCS